MINRFRHIIKLVVCVMVAVLGGSLIAGCSAKTDNAKNTKKVKLNAVKETDSEHKESSDKNSDKNSDKSEEFESSAELEKEKALKETDLENTADKDLKSSDKDLKSAVIYIKDKRIDLADWVDKDITEIIDELDSSLVTFNGVNGTVTSDKQDLDIDKEVIKEAFNNMDADGLLKITMGENEFDDCITLTYMKSLENLELAIDMEEDAEYGDEIAKISENKYDLEYLKNVEFESLAGEGKLFDKVGTLGLESISNNLKYETQLNEKYTYKFSLNKFKIKEGLAGAKEKSTGDVDSVRNRLGIVGYDNKELNINELVDLEDITKVFDKLKEFGMTGAEYRFDTSYSREDIPNTKLKTEDLNIMKDEAVKILDSYNKNSEHEAFKNGSLVVTTYLEPTDEQRTGKINVIYSIYFVGGKIDRKVVQVINNDDGEVYWTTDKLRINPKDKIDSTDELIKGLNNKEKNIYYLQDSNYSIEVWLEEFDKNTLEDVILTKTMN